MTMPIDHKRNSGPNTQIRILLSRVLFFCEFALRAMSRGSLLSLSRYSLASVMSRRCGFAGVGLEAIDQAANGDDAGAAGLKLFAQPVGVDFNRVGGDLFAPCAQQVDQ